MNKNTKIILFALYFCIINLVILLIIAIFTKSGANIFETIFSPKHYISFDKLEEVTVCYQSDTFSCASEKDTTYCEVIVKDKDFLELIERAYRHKIVNDYYTGGALSKGHYKIIIDENTELCTSGLGGLLLDYNNRYFLVKFNEEIYTKMLEFIKPKLEYIDNKNIK